MRTQIIEKIRNNGVVGAGGAGLPTHIKADASVDTVLINGASCEPLLMSDPYLLEHEGKTLIRGLLALMDCVGAPKGLICLKGKHAHAMQAIGKASARYGKKRTEVVELGDFYPAGDEQVLVHEVLGRTVPERGLPLHVGAVVSNVESVLNIAHALHDVPVTHRYLTVAGEVRTPMVVKVPVGTSVMDIIAFAGGATIPHYCIIDGGPMMGRVLHDSASASVTKTTSGLLLLPEEHNVVARKVMEPARVRKITVDICCQCTRCTDLCPRNLLGHSLHPHKIMRVLPNYECESDIAKEALLCSECGICEKFACPMGLSPREVNAQIKQILMREKIQWSSNSHSLQVNPFREYRRIPTKRLIERLDVVAYDSHPAYAGEFTPPSVAIHLKQHIGAPAVCCVSVGDTVSIGDLIGEIPENAMAARVHASISGTVISIDNSTVTIKA